MAIKTTFLHQFFDDNGDPLNGGKVYFYEAGTSTPKDTYTTSAGTTPNANPVILNSRGEAAIWTNGLYKIDVKTSADVQVTGYPVDNVGAGSSNNDSTLRWAGTSTGSANAHVLTPTTSITAYAIGQSFVFKAGYTNSGATTVAVSGLAAIAVQNNFSACAGGEIIVGRLYQVVLDTLTTAQITIGDSGSVLQSFSALTVELGHASDTTLSRVSAGVVAIEGVNILTTATGVVPAFFAPITNSLGADVALSNVALFYTGPTVAQGATGTWFASGTVTVANSSATSTYVVKLWDGTTTIASATATTAGAGQSEAISVSGYITSPTGNIRISVKDISNAVNTNIKFNNSGESKDSTVTAIRVG